jgi:hypothetical protein
MAVILRDAKLAADSTIPKYVCETGMFQGSA